MCLEPRGLRKLTSLSASQFHGWYNFIIFNFGSVNSAKFVHIYDLEIEKVDEDKGESADHKSNKNLHQIQVEKSEDQTNSEVLITTLDRSPSPIYEAQLIVSDSDDLEEYDLEVKKVSEENDEVSVDIEAFKITVPEIVSIDKILRGVKHILPIIPKNMPIFKI